MSRPRQEMNGILAPHPAIGWITPAMLKCGDPCSFVPGNSTGKSSVAGADVSEATGKDPQEAGCWAIHGTGKHWHSNVLS